MSSPASGPKLALPSPQAFRDAEQKNQRGVADFDRDTEKKLALLTQESAARQRAWEVSLDNPAVRQAAIFQAPAVAAPAAILPPQAQQAEPPEREPIPLNPEQQRIAEEHYQRQLEQAQAVVQTREKISRKINRLDTQCTGNLDLAKKRLKQIQTAAIVVALAIAILASFHFSLLTAFALGLIAYIAFSSCADRFYQPEKWEDVVQGLRTERFKGFLKKRMMDEQKVSLKNILQLAQECKNEEPRISSWTSEFDPTFGSPQMQAGESEDQ